jgi:trimeric autotransporter adhesin
MTAIGGARDTLLQATTPRFSTVADGKAILMSGSTPVFRVNSAGAGAPGSIAITAKPVNVVGDIVFSVSAGTQLSVNGNVATVDFANMSTDTALVQARIREFGVDYIANYMISKVFDGVAGDTGLPGLNTGQAFAYKRSAVAPTDSPGDVIFTFATASITTPAGNDLANGWSKNIPAGSTPLYVRVAAASSRNATDNIVANEWAGAVLLAKDGAAGANGSNGQNGVDGLSVAPVRIYQRGATNIAPALPSAACTFTFATGALAGLNNGWSTQVPTEGGAYLFTSGATAASRGATDDIPASEWAAATRLAADGVTTYTWVKYGNTAAGGGFSDSPVGMTYIGLAYNKATPVESENPADYAWSLIKGADGVNGAPGADGKTTFTWIKYSDNADGTGLYDIPRDSTLYLGLAVNKLSAVPSTNKADYAWSKFRGGQGVAGPSGQRGTVTVTAPGYSTWSDASAVYELGHAGYGAPINRDVVTLYDATHAVTKFFVDGAWEVLGTVLNGNLLVEGSVAAEALSVDNLAAINANLGSVVAGDLYGTTLHGGAGYPTNAYRWPSNGGGGFHLSSAGLLLGNYSLGQYIELRSDGFVAMPGLKIEGGRATFSGNFVSGVAPGFRIEMGPDDPVYAMWAGAGAKNDVNAIFYLKRSGAGYFGGALTAGTLRTAVTSPEINPNAQLINGPFGSNGGLIAVICSFDWQRSLGSTRATYTAEAGSTRAVVSLYRGLAGAPADTLLARSTFTGPPAAIENTLNTEEMSTCKLSVSGSFTFTDDARSTADHTYRVTVAMVEQAVTIGTRPGIARPPVNTVYQRLSNTTVE